MVENLDGGKKWLLALTSHFTHSFTNCRWNFKSCYLDYLIKFVANIWIVGGFDTRLCKKNLIQFNANAFIIFYAILDATSSFFYLHAMQSVAFHMPE